MKNLHKQYRKILIISLLLLGINSISGSIVINALQNYWIGTCNIYPNSGFWCENSTLITTFLAAGAVAFVAGYFLLVKWLKLIDMKQMALISVTFVVLLLIYTYYDYKHFLRIRDTSGDYFDSGFSFFINWSHDILAALISSLWLLAPTKKSRKNNK